MSPAKSDGTGTSRPRMNSPTSSCRSGRTYRSCDASDSGAGSVVLRVVVVRQRRVHRPAERCHGRVDLDRELGRTRCSANRPGSWRRRTRSRCPARGPRRCAPGSRVARRAARSGRRSPRTRRTRTAGCRPGWRGAGTRGGHQAVLGAELVGDDGDRAAGPGVRAQVDAVAVGVTVVAGALGGDGGAVAARASRLGGSACSLFACSSRFRERSPSWWGSFPSAPSPR